MRNTLLFTVSALFIFTMAGCLKDKRFENNEMGTQVIDIKAVALTQASASPVVVGITGQAAAVVVDGPIITTETSFPASADVHITLVYDQSLVTAAGLTPLPAGTFSLNTLNAVIPAGSSNIQNLKLTVTKSNVLDPNKIYGVGFKIASVDQGYQIAANMSTVVIGFAIKNKYDGIYQLHGHHNRVPYTFDYDTKIHLVTVGPNSVIFYWPEPGYESNGHPIGVGPGSLSWYGPAISPVIVFDPATDLVTNVYNNPPNPTVITLFTGAGSRLSKYNPATKAITVDWNYNGNPLRAFFDDLTYIGPRP